MRIAVGTVDGKFVQALTNQIANDHQDISLQIVPTQGSGETAQAISKGQADLAMLPSNLDDSVNWPVIAILRQNVMALIVPPPSAAGDKTTGGKTAASPNAPAAKAAKGGKSAKGAKRKSAKTAKGGKTAKSDDSDDATTATRATTAATAEVRQSRATCRQAHRHRDRQ